MMVQFLQPEMTAWLAAVPVVVALWLAHFLYRWNARQRTTVQPRFRSLSRRSTWRRDAVVLVLAVFSRRSSRADVDAAAGPPRAPDGGVRTSGSHSSFSTARCRCRRVTCARHAPSVRSRKSRISSGASPRPSIASGWSVSPERRSFCRISPATSTAFSFISTGSRMTQPSSTAPISAPRSPVRWKWCARTSKPTRKLLLVISDGEDQGSTLQEALTAVKAKRLRVHTIGIGSAQESVIPVSFPGERESLLKDEGGRTMTTRFNESSLRAVAAATGGPVHSLGHRQRTARGVRGDRQRQSGADRLAHDHRVSRRIRVSARGRRDSPPRHW